MQLTKADKPGFDNQFMSGPIPDIMFPELTVDRSGADFRLWSPRAMKVRLLIYESAFSPYPLLALPMVFDPETGIWSAHIDGNLFGRFYTFKVCHRGQWLKETPGITPKATGPNGLRGAIIDLALTNPPGWNSDHGPHIENFTDAVIYEMHYRDFSAHSSSGIIEKGKFLALTERHTTSPLGEKTGIDHLRELGVTHVQILPSFDFSSVDEFDTHNNTYNWGYDPLNYNVPEGSFSTNAANPATRIREMKLMVRALHEAGIGVIMDVVYNHTSGTDDSNFELTAPGFYYRHRNDGTYSNASGCGNETASERPQMRNFIVDSVKYWVSEYHMDGFRFDLMAIHDIETMNFLAGELRKINPGILIYGEGWTAADSPLPPKKRALKENVAKMRGVAVFSDDIRDAVKGHFADYPDRGFATGKPGMEESVKIGIVAALPHPQVDYSKGSKSRFPYASSPEMIVNYVSCHDNLTLTDKLHRSMTDEPHENLIAAAKLAHTIVFTSQGIPFLFAGEEIFRDRKGVDNAFNCPDSINAIDWTNKTIYRDLFDYIRNLITLRKTHPAFRMTHAEEIVRNLVFDTVDSRITPNLISYSLCNHANNDPWEEIKVIFNGASVARSINIPYAEWLIVASDGWLQPNGSLGTTGGGTLVVAPYSALILAKR